MYVPELQGAEASAADLMSAGAEPSTEAVVLDGAVRWQPLSAACSRATLPRR